MKSLIIIALLSAISLSTPVLAEIQPLFIDTSDTSAVLDRLGLGTAATTASSSYATAAQGSSAEAAYAASVTNATSSNTASAIVKRDASGNFSAGTITAALTGNASTATNAEQLGGVAAVNYGQMLTANTTINIGTAGKATMYLDNAAAVDKGSGLVGLPCTGHSFVSGDPIKIIGGTASVYNDDNYTVDASSTVNEIVVAASAVSVYYFQPDTAATMKALIAAQPRNLGGKTLTFQFRDGWFTLTTPLVFDSFYSGILIVYGNAADNTAAKRKRAVISGSAKYVLDFRYNACASFLYYPGIRSTYAVSGGAAVRMVYTSGMAEVRYCGILSDNAGATGVLSQSSTFSYVASNYFSGGARGVFVFNCPNALIKDNVSESANKPIYGLVSDSAIVLVSGTLLTGSTANTSGREIIDITP
jgi:hypothetical protein